MRRAGGEAQEGGSTYSIVTEDSHAGEGGAQVDTDGGSHCEGIAEDGNRELVKRRSAIEKIPRMRWETK